MNEFFLPLNHFDPPPITWSKGFSGPLPIEYLRLSPRAYGALLRAGIEDIGQLRAHLENGGILMLRQVGPKLQAEIETAYQSFLSTLQ